MASNKLLTIAKKTLAIFLVLLFSVSIPTTVFASSDEIVPEISNEEVEENTDAETPSDEENDGNSFLEGLEFLGFTESPFKKIFSTVLDYLINIKFLDEYSESPFKTFFSAIYELILSVFGGGSETAQICA